MVNFRKCVRLTDRIKIIKLYQTHTYENNINMNHNFNGTNNYSFWYVFQDTILVNRRCLLLYNLFDLRL